MNILVLISNEIIGAQRIGKEIETLVSAGHQITVIELPSADGVPSPPDSKYELLSVDLMTRQLPRNLIFWPIKFLEMTFRFFVLGCKIKPDIIHCVDRIPLLSAYIIARTLGINYIYDSQEIHSGVKGGANKPKWFWLKLERFLAKRAVRVFVTDHFRLDITADILKLETSKLYALMSYPFIPQVEISGRMLREECPWPKSKILLYAGSICRNRHIEEIVKSIPLLPPEYNLVLLGFIEADYKDELSNLAKQLDISKRMVILPPVRWSELPSYIASADCAFAFYEKNSLNNYYCSPSKLFDSLMAGIPVISSDNPLVMEVLLQNDAGICISEVSPEKIAIAVNELFEKEGFLNIKNRLAALAREKYSWESQVEKFNSVYLECQ